MKRSRIAYKFTLQYSKEDSGWVCTVTHFKYLSTIHCNPRVALDRMLELIKEVG